MVLLDKQSWDLMPDWLRPVPSQLTTPHSAWIDRIPWYVIVVQGDLEESNGSAGHELVNTSSRTRRLHSTTLLLLTAPASS